MSNKNYSELDFSESDEYLEEKPMKNKSAAKKPTKSTKNISTSDSSSEENDNTRVPEIKYADVLPSNSIILFEPNVSPCAKKSFNEKMISIIKKINVELFDPINFKYWNNVVISGGYVVDLLFETNNSSDIDVYIYNLKSQSMIDTIASTITRLVSGVIVCETKGVMTIRTKTGKKMQIINTGNKKTVSEILDNFDLNMCKVAFDGYQIIYGMENIKLFESYLINFADIKQRNQTTERLAKYVHKKHVGLIVPESIFNTIDPLYLFRESHGFNKFLQLTKLCQDTTLEKIYKMIVIRKNFDSNNLNNMIRYSKVDRTSNYGNSSKKDSALKGKSLSAHLKDRETFAPELFNKFGQPILFENIRKGTYKFEDLYNQQISDMCGFNVTCMLVLYEPDQDKVISFLKEIYKVGSKNMNRYKMNYLTMASLMNRLKIVTYLMNADNYKFVMNIAMKEDNLELYRLAYCTHSSKDRYLYDKNMLLKYKAYNIYRELYDSTELIDVDVAQPTIRDNVVVAKDLSNEDLIVMLADSDKRVRQQNYIVEHSYKTIVEMEDAEYRKDSMTDVETLMYVNYLEKINKETDVEYNRMLKNLVSMEEYKKLTTIKFSNPTRHLSLKDKSMLIKIHKEHKIKENYDFKNNLVNDLIIYLDDPKMIKHTEDKHVLMDMLSGRELGPNLKKFVEEHMRKTIDPTLYSEILSNTDSHNSAYLYSVIEADYERKENALGYTPCDIIIYQTIRDYVNDYGNIRTKNAADDSDIRCSKYLDNRRKSVRMIDYSKKIINYEASENVNKIRKILPELFIIGDQKF